MLVFIKILFKLKLLELHYQLITIIFILFKHLKFIISIIMFRLFKHHLLSYNPR